MAFATEDRMAVQKLPGSGTAPIAAGVQAFKNCLCLLNNTGYYDPENAVVCRGVVIDPLHVGGYDNRTGDAGDKTVRFSLEEKVPFAAEEGAAPTIAHLGAALFAVDDQIVSLLPYSATGPRPFVGYVRAVDDEGVWIDFAESSAPADGTLAGYIVAPLQTLLADEALVFNTGQKFYPIVGQSGAVELSEAFPDGSHVGQEIVLVGTDNTNTVAVPNGINTKTQSGQTVTLGAGDTVSFVWYGGDWIETSRSINNA